MNIEGSLRSLREIKKKISLVGMATTTLGTTDMISHKKLKAN